MKKSIVILLAILLTSIAFGESMTWELKKGDSVDGEVVNVTSSKITVLTSEGKRKKISIKRLTRSSQKDIASDVLDLSSNCSYRNWSVGSGKSKKLKARFQSENCLKY